MILYKFIKIKIFFVTINKNKIIVSIFLRKRPYNFLNAGPLTQEKNGKTLQNHWD